MCPVISWANVIQRINNYPGTTSSSPINLTKLNNRLYNISSKDNINFLWKSVKSLDHKKLGFKANKIGTHSFRSGGTMAMKLSGAEDSTI
jgi:hypothetical protein